MVVAVSAVIYWLADRDFDAGRGDFFYLADAFLHGRTWLTFQPGPYDVIIRDGRFYVPFAPFPAVVFMPLVAVLGAVTRRPDRVGHQRRPRRGGVGLCWMLLARIGVRRLVDRLALTILFGFSTQILWVTTRGGVWHTGQLIATILTFACLIELWGKQRAWLIGLLAGAAFLTRAPLAFAIPFYALMLEPRDGPRRRPRWPVATSPRSPDPSGCARGPGLALGVLPADRRVLRLQPGPVRVAVRIRLRAGDAPGVPRGEPRAGPVLARAPPDEPGLLPLPPAQGHPGLPVSSGPTA